MHRFLSLLVIATCFVWTSFAVPPGYVLHEKRHYTSPKWVKRDRIEAHTLVPVSIGLTQNSLHMGEEFIMDISDPDSPNYGKHWTQDEVISKFAPSEETVEAVKAWLRTAAIDLDRVVHYENKGWLVFLARIDELENLIHSEFFEYEHIEKGIVRAGCEHYHLPADVQPHIDYITPGVKLSAPLKKRRLPGAVSKLASLPDQSIAAPSAGNLKDCFKLTTPECIRALYNIPAKPPKLVPNNTFGLYEHLDTYDQDDLNKFFTKFAKFIPNGTHPVIQSIDGGEGAAPNATSHSIEGEAILDIEMAYPIIYPNKMIMYSVDDDFYYDSHASGLFNTWLDALDGSYCHYKAFGIKGDSPGIDPKYPDPHKGGYKGKLMCGVYKPATVISISYGIQEDGYPENYQKRQCNEFMKLALQGHSIFSASGDTGVSGIDNPKTRHCLGNGTVFNPAEPLCPYMTIVGGTQLKTNALPSEPQVAVTRGVYSSGGFSNIFPRPKYQEAKVGEYFKNHKPKYKSYAEFGLKDFANRTGRYNRLGRGVPDVAASAANVAVSVRGRYSTSGGTSASSPLFAAIVSRINGERILAGKSPVGFVNPVLYKHPEVLLDVTSGNNPGCGTKGFSAVPGWDPVTGLGTPNYGKMLKLFMSLP